MKGIIVLLVAVVAAEGAAILVLMGADPPAPIGGQAGTVTVTAYVTTSGPQPPTPPANPMTADAGEPADPAERAAYWKDKFEKANQAFASMAPRMRTMVEERERMRNELTALRTQHGVAMRVPEDPAPGVPDDQLTKDQQKLRLERMAKLRHGAVWTAGYTVPDGLLPGMTEAQRTAVEAAMQREQERTEAQVRDFVRRELGDDAPPGLDTMPFSRLYSEVVAPQLGKGFVKLGEQPLLTHLKMLRNETGLGTVLGADHFNTRLARVLETVRRDTWAEMAGSLAPDQLALVKGKYLPLGIYRYAGLREMAVGVSGD